MFAPLIGKPQVRTVGRPSDTSALRPHPTHHDQDVEPARTSARFPVAWDFSKIPVSPPGRNDGPERLDVGAATDPLEYEADRVAAAAGNAPESVRFCAPVQDAAGEACHFLRRGDADRQARSGR